MIRDRRLYYAVAGSVKIAVYRNQELVPISAGHTIDVLAKQKFQEENEGFNRQKNWQGDITHACSWNETAIKNYYLMMQISDMIKQLYEWFYLKANEIIKGQKNISSELLASFGRQLTREDISQCDMHSISVN